MLMIMLSFACTGIKSPLGEAGKSRQLLSARIISKLVSISAYLFLFKIN